MIEGQDNLAKAIEKAEVCGGPGCSDSFRRLLSGSSVLRLGCQRFWQAVEVDLVGDVAIDRQNHFIAS
jgi:hypothetical protein